MLNIYGQRRRRCSPRNQQVRSAAERPAIFRADIRSAFTDSSPPGTSGWADGAGSLCYA